MAEIAIVGGGPSGAMCGEQLAKYLMSASRGKSLAAEG
jgi:flavin-dependent dehydrogenase